MKLMADNYEDDHFKSSHSSQTNHKPSPDQVRLLLSVLEKPVCFHFSVYWTSVLQIWEYKLVKKNQFLKIPSLFFLKNTVSVSVWKSNVF